MTELLNMKRILVVDDNDDVRFSVIDGLKSLSKDFEFVEASSGKEAMKKADKEKIDLILLDIMMPGMDGWNVAAEMKAGNSTKKIPIIFLTAKTDDLSKGMSTLIAEDYVEKPFNLKELLKRINAVLK